MYPHERSLVKKFKDQPFVILGINSDPKSRLLKTMKRENITWRSWWDGGNTKGPIATAWKVRGWPDIYVLDEHGIIRYIEVSGYRLEKAIHTLLEEMKSQHQ